MTFKNEMVKILDSLNIPYNHNEDYYNIENLKEIDVTSIIKEINNLIKKYNKVCMNTITSNSITIRDITSLQ